MSAAKHTPGPWEFLEDGRTEDEGNAARPLTICSPARDDLAEIYSRDDATVSVSRGEAIANARLIAAAPELLACLLELLDIEGPQPGTAGWAVIARAVIDKATGADQ